MIQYKRRRRKEKRRERKKRKRIYFSFVFRSLSLLFITCISLIDDIKIYENKIIAILITKELKNVLS